MSGIRIFCFYFHNFSELIIVVRYFKTSMLIPTAGKAKIMVLYHIVMIL